MNTLDASTLIDTLLENQRLVSILATDPHGNPAMYQILSPESEVFPRIAVFENDREYTRFADDAPIEDENLTPRQVGRMMTMDNMETVLDAVSKALLDAKPEDEAAQEAAAADPI